MTMARQLGAWAASRTLQHLSSEAVAALKIRLLDSLGCAIAALGAPPMQLARAQLEDFGGNPRCTLIGGGASAPDRAAFYNGALVRYLDFNDSYLAPGETCHPSDNVAPVLAATEYAQRSGEDFLVALAVAYQVQCRLSDVAPVRHKGFDHTTQGSYGVAAGVARALGLDAERTANAVAIAGTAFNALRVTRTGNLSHWKGLAYPNTAFGATGAAFLAMRGITGPEEVFEGNKGFMDAIAGRFEMDWAKEDCDRATQTILKKYNAEIHSQSAIEGLLELQQEHGFAAKEVAAIELDIFDVAFHIIGGGEEGGKKAIRTKEEADHSLPYLLAVALLDGTVMPAQYEAERIRRSDVQSLLQEVTVRQDDALSRRFPAEMPCRITVRLADGTPLHREKSDYEGFLTRPMAWESAVEKFQRLTARMLDSYQQKEIAVYVSKLENLPLAELTAILGKVRRQQRKASA